MLARRRLTLLEGVGVLSLVNLLTFPNNFENGAWTKSRVTITADNLAVASGFADRITETATTGSHTLTRSLTVDAGYRYTLSCKFKAGERSTSGIQIFSANFASGANVAANLSAGTVGGGKFGTAFNSANLVRSITPLGNSEYLVSLSFDVPIGQTTMPIEIGIDGSYVGDGTSGLYMWEASLTGGPTPF